MKPLVYRWNNSTHGSVLVGEHLVRLQKFHCLICATSPKYNPRKAVYKAPKHCQLPNGPLEVWQMNFTLLPLSHVYKNVLVMVCIFSYLPRWISGKESTCRRCGFDPWVMKIPCRKKGLPLQYSFLENPMDRGAWQATVLMVSKSWTQLKQLSTHALLLLKKITPTQGAPFRYQRDQGTHFPGQGTWPSD